MFGHEPGNHWKLRIGHAIDVKGSYSKGGGSNLTKNNIRQYSSRSIKALVDGSEGLLVFGAGLWRSSWSYRARTNKRSSGG